jgi:hypothetical protein
MRIYQRIGRRFWGQIFACEIRQAARREATNRPPRLGDELCSGDPVPLLGGQRHLHRNARCPCGRGRKYKRCCGRRRERGSSASVRHTDATKPQEWPGQLTFLFRSVVAGSRRLAEVLDAGVPKTRLTVQNAERPSVSSVFGTPSSRRDDDGAGRITPNAVA